MDRAEPDVRAALAGDILLSHLLALHGIRADETAGKTFIPADALLRKPSKAGGPP
jgi:hypothetical protein